MGKRNDRGQSSQSDKFIETARELGADGDTSAADKLMGRLAKTLPRPRGKPANQKHLKDRE